MLYTNFLTFNLLIINGLIFCHVLKKMLENGSPAPAIKVANGVIIEGNHRYVAGRLYGVEPPIVEGTLSPSQKSRIVPIQKTKVNPLDFEKH